MFWRPGTRISLFVTLCIILLSLLSISPGNMRANAFRQNDLLGQGILPTSNPLEFRITGKEAQANLDFMPIVRHHWTPPCDGIPYLIGPPDGSQIGYVTMLVLDGGYRGGGYDWLEVEFSKTPDFTDSSGHYLQPAGKRWELGLGDYNLEPGKWYWRASIWCHGPGWPPPPVGYEQSPYSQVWSFTYAYNPYPHP